MIKAEQIIKQCFDLAVGMYPPNTSSAEQRNAYQISLLESKLREVVAMHNRIVPAGRAHMRDMPSPAADGAALTRRALAPIEKTNEPPADFETKPRTVGEVTRERIADELGWPATRYADTHDGS